MTEIEDDGITYAVVMNHEEQYSIWPVDRDIPDGWHKVGVSGHKSECLDYIEEVWTDIRPLSVRQKISGMSREEAAKDQ
jgi:MbtH protein